MNNYKIGDRIIMIRNFDNALINMIGTIRGYKEDYAIEFDKDFKGGHSCQGLIKSNRGQWVEEDCFKLYIEDKIEVGDKVEFTRTIGNIKKGFKGIVRGKTIDLSLFDVVLTDCGSCSDRGEIWCVPRSSIRLIEKHTKPIKQQNWNISIIPDGDKTTLSLTVNGEQKEYTVKRYEKDTYSIEAAVKALVEKAFKLDLYLSLGESENYGKIGTPTGYHDKDGKPLFVGDVVAIHDPDSFEIAHEYVVYRNLKTFIMGIAWHCNDNTGKISYWTVEKIKDYSMAQVGDKIGNVEVVSE